MKRDKMGVRYLGFCTALLSCVSLLLNGCFAFYPEIYDGSGFEEFQYRFETDPPCTEYPFDFDGTVVCEATITRVGNGEYVAVVSGVHPGSQSDSPFLAQRAMTESEIERMFIIFGGLEINRHPWPFCTLFSFVPFLGEQIFRWDDLELVILDCDRPRLDRAWALVIRNLLFDLSRDEVFRDTDTTE